MSIDDSRRRTVLQTMIKARVFEERLGDEFAKQRAHAKAAFGGRNSAFEDYNRQYRIPIQGNIELSIGQEATPAAMCSWLSPEDYAAGTHRSHSLAIAKGVDPKALLAEIYGRATGLCAGKAGDFMLNDPTVNFENSAIMAQLTAVALGHAFARKRLGSRAVATVFIGEGASNQGVVHESMNLAAVWKLPVVFVIEDNGYAISTPRHKTHAVADISLRAGAYGMPGTLLEDHRTDDLIEACGRAVTAAREGAGPSLIVARTNRLRGAFEGDDQSYRPPGELDDHTANDALTRYRDLLLSHGVVDDGWVTHVTEQAHNEFQAALEFAEASPYPSPAQAEKGLFA